MDTIKKRILLFPFNILYNFNPVLSLKILFRLKQGYKLNLKNPETFNEKIQWIKLYDKNPLMPKCVDKYTVRDYVERKGCGEILNDLLWEGFNPEDIPFDRLPRKFVIKVTHGSTFNIICNNKNDLDVEKTIKTLKKWLNEKFLPCYGEWFYGIEKPRIIVEKYIDSANGLKDYKVFCFNGKAKFIGVYSNRFNGKTCQELYDLDWNLINGFTGDFNKPSNYTTKPKNFLQMICFAEKLAKDFKHVRVDFFNENDKLIFGELTFTSGAGFDRFSDKKLDFNMGKFIEINEVNYDKSFNDRSS